MALNPTQLNRVDLYVKTIFKKAMSEDFTDHAAGLYAVTPNKTGIARILSLTSVPGLRRWLSERRPGTFKFQTEMKKVGKWEQSVAINGEDVEDDELGIYKSAIEEMALENKLVYGNLATEAINKGFVTSMSDGKKFFSTDHGNLQTGALTGENFDKACLKLEMQRDDKGKSYGYLATTLIVGPANKAAARAVVKKEYLAGGESNPNFDVVKIVVLPQITDTSWYVADLSRSVKPVEVVERRKVGPLRQMMKDRQDDADIYTWGTDGRFDAAYSNYRLIVGSTGA
nr:MAG TPA: major capsid protein [Caudoviricetes sp.]